jgi:preprotein translocase subunit SecG
VGLKETLDVVQILVAISVIALILLQTKGSGFSGLFGGDSGSVYRTRRGLEKRMFQVTIGLAALFFVIAFANSFKF